MSRTDNGREENERGMKRWTDGQAGQNEEKKN